MNIIGIIPARGGSKGVANKNIKKLNGKPLVAYSIEAALNSSLITDIIVSTDDNKISKACSPYNIDVIRRPKKIAGDNSLVMDTVKHTISKKKKEGKKYSIFVLLEPTAPFRTPADIDQTIDLLLTKDADSAATFSETTVPPTRIWKIERQNPQPFIPGSDPFLPRQKQQIGYYLNGMVYAMKTSTLKAYPDANSFLLGNVVAHIINRNFIIDIDTETDFFIAEQMMKLKQNL